MEVKKLELRVTGLDPKRLSSQFIAAQVKYGGRTYEDVLTFANWKVFRGDLPGAAKPDTNISAWETVPLSRFWSSLDNRPGTTWYRREFFVAKDNNDITMLFERPRDSVTEIYVNGVLARTEKWGRSYRPRIEKEMVNLGATNTIVIKYTKKEDNGEPAWCTAFRGSEDRYNRDWIKLNPGRELKVKRGGKASFTVEISNPFAQQAAGQALLASPIETWGEAGGYSMIDISPLERDFTAAPSGKAKMAFEVSVPPDALPGTFPAAVKVVLKGTAVYSDTLIIKVE